MSVAQTIAKLQALAAPGSGATDGERAAAREAICRLQERRSSEDCCECPDPVCIQPRRVYYGPFGSPRIQTGASWVRYCRRCGCQLTGTWIPHHGFQAYAARSETVYGSSRPSGSHG